MHIPDGFMNGGVAMGAGAVAAGGLGIAVHRTKEFLEDKQVALAGLVAAFVFAVQMLNFPVAAGTSGHLMGGVLAAVLVGPWTAALCLAVVLMVQALFADGGLTALGLNIVNIALVPTFGGYALFLVLRRILPSRRRSVILGAGIAAGISVALAAAAFVIEFALGGSAPVSLSTTMSAMLGVHSLIGIGEGLITAATVSLVLGVRPDLVHGASHLPLPSLVVDPREGAIAA
ncbi:MAG: energy-coupling factor ABC transporter permease [Actinomycetota bacterium]